MGAVYEALDARLHRTVALKETLVESDDLRRAFAREAHLLANLSHPALPKVIDHFSEGDGEYLVMDHIAGADLSQQLAGRGEPFPTQTVLRWADELLDALEYLHGNEPPIIHRDIKPSNLKLTPKGCIVLLDFGLAKGTAGQMTRVQASQSILGYTPNYAALEQIQGERTSPRSDLYSLAATLYHLLTGKTPVDALKRATEVLHDEPDPLRPIDELNPQVPRAVANVLMRALALRPTQRPESAAQLRAELQQARAARPADATLPAYQTTIVNESARSTVAPATATDAPAATDAFTPQALERETMLLTKRPAPASSAAPAAIPPAAHDTTPPQQTSAQARGETLTVVAPRTTTPRRRWPLLAGGAALCALLLAGVLFAVRPWQHAQPSDTTPAVNQTAQPTGAPSAPAQANQAPANTAPPNAPPSANTAQPSGSVANARPKAEQPKPDENGNATARAREQRAAEQQSEAAQAAAEQQRMEQQRAQQEAAQATQAATAELQRELASAQDDLKRAITDAINAQASVQQARTAAVAAERDLQRLEAQRGSGQIDQAAVRDARQRNAEARVAYAMALAHAKEQKQAAQAANARVQQLSHALANVQTRNAPHRQ